jgi:hypothetical protein
MVGSKSISTVAIPIRASTFWCLTFGLTFVWQASRLGTIRARVCGGVWRSGPLGGLNRRSLICPSHSNPGCDKNGGTPRFLQTGGGAADEDEIGQRARLNDVGVEPAGSSPETRRSRLLLAPRVGLEPTTLRLTARIIRLGDWVSCCTQRGYRFRAHDLINRISAQVRAWTFF